MIPPGGASIHHHGNYTITRFGVFLGTSLRREHRLQTEPRTAAFRVARKFVPGYLLGAPDDPWLAEVACGAHLFAGVAEQANAACERASGRENFWAVQLVLAAAYANHGEMAKAAAAKVEALRTVPALTITQLRAKRGSANPEYMDLAERYWYVGMRKAGVPEK